MKFFEASIKTVIFRYYLLMAVVIGSFFVNLPALALMALPIFLSAILGVSFKSETKSRREIVKPTGTVAVLEKRELAA